MKKLVVYYSNGGNTRAVARRIARTLRADVVEIKPVKAYPDDYDVLVSLGKKEVESGYLPQIEPVAIDFSKYDAVVIGSPVWWYTFAPAVRTFLKNYSLKGMKVFPFATNGGWLGHTPSDFRKALRGAQVGAVLNVKFEEHTQITPDSTIKEWIAQIK